MNMSDISTLGVILIAFTVLGGLLVVMYYKGWCCDGGMIQPEMSATQTERQNVERKIKYQIKKMVEAERVAKRLAQIATNGTGEDPNEYFDNLRNLLFPTSVPDNIHEDPFSWINPTSEGANDDDNINISSDQEFHPSFHITYPMGIEHEESLAYNAEFDEPPSYEECMQNNNKYDFV